MSKIRVTVEEEKGEVCLKVSINDSLASIADLLEAWQPFCMDANIYKAYAPGNHNDCKGCLINCCETAFLIPDLIAFKKICTFTKQDERTFIHDCFDCNKTHLGLLRLKSNPCIFLKNKVCSIYDVRSLMCRFYLCTNLASDTEQLLYTIAGVGCAATQVYALNNSLLPPSNDSGSTSFDRLFINLFRNYENDPRINLFLESDEYHQIPLAPFISNSLLPY